MYCTLEDLTTRYGEEEIRQLTDREADGDIVTSITDRAIADAKATIDGYLASHYSLPLAAIPANLKRIACDITRFYLYENDVTDIVQIRFDQALRYLEQVARGTISLGPDTNGLTPSIGDGAAQFVSDVPVFKRDPEA